MSQSEKIKEEIGWLKVAFGIMMAIQISLIGWLANHYDDVGISVEKLYASVVGIIVISIVVIIINKMAFKRMEELGDL